MKGRQMNKATPRRPSHLPDGSAGVRTRAQRATLGDAAIDTSHIKMPSTTSSEEESSSDSQSESPTPREKGKPDGGPRGRVGQGGFGFEGLVLPRADLSRFRKNRPSGCGRSQNCNAEMTEKLTKANTALMLAALPDSLPCRDQEKERIQSVLEDFFKQRTGRSLYVCGVPGTGKTATTMEVVNKYKTARKDTDFLLLNCLSMATVSDLYSALHSGLVGKHSGKQSAFAQLNRYFTETKKLTVIILDEMDVLLTKKSTELYNLFEWCWEGGKLCILGISNTVNLPQRLPAPIQKRMGTNTLTFKPYTKKQMESIIKDRLGVLDVFQEVAIQRAAAKVSHANGDIRRCLQLLQLSIDVFKRPTAEPGEKITAHHVGEAITEMFGDEILSDLSVTEKLILSALVFSSRAASQSQSESDAVRFQEILDRVADTARLSDLPIPRDAFILKSLRDLHTVGIVKIDDLHKRLFERIQLNVAESDLIKSISEDARLERVSTSLRL